MLKKLFLYIGLITGLLLANAAWVIARHVACSAVETIKMDPQQCFRSGSALTHFDLFFTAGAFIADSVLIVLVLDKLGYQLKFIFPDEK